MGFFLTTDLNFQQLDSSLFHRFIFLFNSYSNLVVSYQLEATCRKKYIFLIQKNNTEWKRRNWEEKDLLWIFKCADENENSLGLLMQQFRLSFEIYRNGKKIHWLENLPWCQPINHWLRGPTNLADEFSTRDSQRSVCPVTNIILSSQLHLGTWHALCYIELIISLITNFKAQNSWLVDVHREKAKWLEWQQNFIFPLNFLNLEYSLTYLIITNHFITSDLWKGEFFLSGSPNILLT